MDRANRIAYEYGMRLAQIGKNASEDAVLKLVAGYPDHGFVIDEREARTLFERVRQPSALEVELESTIALKHPIDHTQAAVFFVDTEAANEKEKADGADGKAEPGGAAEGRPD